MKRSFLFISIIGLGIFLRSWSIDQFPPGFYSDEALYGYEAYSLLLTGKDQFGNLWPLSIAGFGDYRPALYIYFTIPFIKIFGLNEHAVRLASLIPAIITLFIFPIFIFRITKNSKATLIATLLYAISGWGIYFSRMAHESNLVTLFILLGALLFLYIPKKPVLLFGSIFFLGLSLYVYHNARIIVPIFVIAGLYYMYKNYQLSTRYCVIGIVGLCLIFLPLINEFKNERGWARVRGISIWTDPGKISLINSLRGNSELNKISPTFARIIYNKVTVYSYIFVVNLVNEFNPDFLIKRGDNNILYSTPNNGILMWIDPFLVVIGFYYFYKRNVRKMIWVASALLIGLFPDALTRTGPSSARIHVILPVVMLLSGVGLYKLTQFLPISRLLTILIIAINTGWFWYHYTVVLPRLQNREDIWQTGVKDMVLALDKVKDRYSRIWISKSGKGWIHLVFHLRYDPTMLQKEIKVIDRNEYGFWWVTDIGKYHMDNFPEKLVNDHQTLYVGMPHEFPNGLVPYQITYNANGNPRYWLSDGISSQ